MSRIEKMGNKNKPRLYIILFLIFIILFCFIFFTYKFIKGGNNNTNVKEDIVNSILDMTGYKAKLEIEVITNKNKTKYIIDQSLNNGNISRQEVLEPSNIAGVVTEYDGNNLKITNNNLNLTTLYEDYIYVVDNNLWLNSFINDYKTLNTSNIIQNDDEIILEVKNENVNKYSTYKRLYIDKSSR